MIKDPNDGVDYFKNELGPHFMKGVEAVFVFRFYQLQKMLPRLRRPPKVDWKTSSLSENASLTPGWTPSIHIHQKILISNKPCKWKMQDYRQMA